MTDAELIATLARLLREAWDLDKAALPLQYLAPRWAVETGDALAEADQRATKPDPHEPGAFW